MVDFRPHSIRKISRESYVDDHGDYVDGEPQYSEKQPCRFESNGQARNILLEDGTMFAYSYSVYLDVDCMDFVYGQQVELFDERDSSIGCFLVKGVRRGQLNTRLWL